ncbi:serine hydrolase domain-containing protein [Brevundimonas sp.]|uniref:serine hydrolase domain-containing protein n=1 Tax=Brevundimonas sp. TaxID=1871086 RepID=UPI002D6ABE22|nr:serine hydrolase domain-containing protein [Brevundimonas sp.]HYC97505.1 serine hydrolase domain-containing protein [Brevundimonas sp.]
MTLALTRRSMLAAATAAPALIAFPAMAQDGPLDAIGRRLVAAINDPALDGAGLADLVASRSLQRRSAGDWLEQFARVRAASGGLEYVSSRQGPREVLVTVRTVRQGVERDLTTFASTAEPGRITDLFLLPRPRPYPRPLIAGPVPRPVLKTAIADRIAWAVEHDDFSGAVLVVAPDGAVLHEQAAGMANRDFSAPVAPDTRFNLGSADKMFTAVMAGGLIAEGRLGLDTRAVEVVPGFAGATGADAVTVRHLLTHTAGLGDMWSRPGYDRRDPNATVTELVRHFAGQPLLFEPGRGVAYSNEGFVLLGAVLEGATGETWYDLLARRVYAPAGMERSGHFTLDETVAGRAVGYRYLESDSLGIEGRRPNGGFLGWRGNSCGGGYSTTADMTAFLRALSSGRLVPDAITEMLTGPAPGGLPDYGMGFERRVVAGRTLIGHNGGGPNSGIDGESFIVRETGWALSVLGNYDAPFAGTLARDLGTMLAAQDG